MITDPFNLTGKVALVTGSTRGIGLSILTRFAQAGARCVINSENADDVARTLKAFKQKSFDVLAFPCDITNPQAQSNMVQQTIEEYGRIDILVCNAGITGQAGPILQSNETDYRRVFDINLHSMVTLANLVQPHMKRDRSGSIILISSIAGLRGNGSINAYALAKAGVAQLARNLAVQWGPDGIRVNSISPGFIQTELSGPLMANKAFMKRRIQMTPLRRTGQVDEIAASVQFLASKASAFVTGHNLVVDGGTLITDGS